MKNVSRPLIALAGVAVIATGCTAAHDAPFDMYPGQSGCQISIGDTQDTSTAHSSMNDYGPMIDEGDETRSERRSAGSDAGEIYWEAEARLNDGTLTVRVFQPSIGEQTESWVVTDIPFEGVTMSGPWGGPYGLASAEGDNYYFTCWTNPPE